MSITETWNSYTGSQTPQEFMNISREKYGADCTVDTAVDRYVADAIGQWIGEGVQDIAVIQRSLVAYLEATQGEEWDIRTN